ncbi:MAG TPA: serine hydrolase, partial [Phytomonospora sp.]
APEQIINGDELTALIGDYLADHGGIHCSVFVSVGDETFEYDADRHYDTASIVKVDILATLLYQHERDGTSLSSRQRTLAKKMITSSDNKATDELYGDIDGPHGLKAANKAFKMTDTTAGWDWGTVKTTARDQVALWRAVMSEGVLGAESVAYLRELTASVVGWQSWGVSAAAGGSDVTMLKNGWDTRTSIGGRWVVNSVGLIEKMDGRAVYLAILSDNHADYDAAVDVVEGLAALVGAQI